MKRPNLVNTSQLTQFFAYIQMLEKERLYLGELQTSLQLSSKQEQDLLSKLSKKGLIIRLKRGVYLVPQKIPPGGKWQPSSLYLISHFMAVMRAKYYIGGAYAFNHYGLSTQIPNVITIYNDKISGTKFLGNLQIQLIKTSTKQIGAVITLQVDNTVSVPLSSLARTIVDAVSNYKRYNTLPIAYKWIAENSDHNFLKELVATTNQFGSISAKRRIGYYLFKLIQDELPVKPILKSLNNTKSWIPLDPTVKVQGFTNKTWRIIDNVN